MRETGVQEQEVHVAGVCVSRGSHPPSVLALKRTDSRSLFPGYWEGVGGQVLPGESLEEAVHTHLREEAGLDGEVVQPFASYVIEPGRASRANKRIPGVRFLVLVDDRPEARIDPRQHTEWRWVPVDQLGQLQWIPGLREQIEDGVRLYRSLFAGNA